MTPTYWVLLPPNPLQETISPKSLQQELLWRGLSIPTQLHPSFSTSTSTGPSSLSPRSRRAASPPPPRVPSSMAELLLSGCWGSSRFLVASAILRGVLRRIWEMGSQKKPILWSELWNQLFLRGKRYWFFFNLAYWCDLAQYCYF